MFSQIPISVYCCQCGTECPAALDDLAKCRSCHHMFCGDRLIGENRKAACGQKQYRFSDKLKCLAITLMIFSMIGENTAVSMLLEQMSGYQNFLLYFPNLIVTSIFLSASIVSGTLIKVITNYRLQFCLILLAVPSVFSGFLRQYGNAGIGPGPTKFLITLTLPAVWLVSWLYFRWRLTFFRLICFLLIVLSLLISTVPGLVDQEKERLIYFMLNLLASLAIAGQLVFLEKLLKEGDLPIIPIVALLNFYCLISYLIALSVTKENQKKAFSCLLGSGDCSKVNLIWLVINCVSQICKYIFQCLLIKYRDACLVAVLASLVLPGTYVMFWCPFIVGDAAETPVWWILIPLIILLPTVIFFERYGKEESELIPEDSLSQLLSENKVLSYILLDVPKSNGEDKPLMANTVSALN